MEEYNKNTKKKLDKFNLQVNRLDKKIDKLIKLLDKRTIEI